MSEPSNRDALSPLLDKLLEDPDMIKKMLSAVSLLGGGAITPQGSANVGGSPHLGGQPESSPSLPLSSKMSPFEAGSTQSPAEAQDLPAQASSPPPSPLQGLLSDPQVLEHLPKIISMLKPMLSAATSEEAVAVGGTVQGANEAPGGTEETAQVSASPTQGSAEVGNFGLWGKKPLSYSHPKKPPFDKRLALLAALKPYLSHERCEAIDYILKVSKLGILFKNLNI